MAKPSVPYRDQYARLSYLYELSTTLSKNPKTATVGRYYGRTLKTVAKKNVLRMSPEIKRTLCKSCDSKLIPGLTCSIRLENLSKDSKSHCDVLKITCKACGLCKRFPVGANPNYVLWSDAVEDVVVS